MTNKEYHSLNTHISKSGLDEIAQSPAHYYDKYVLGNKSEQTPAMALGSAFHSFVLEIDKFVNEFAISEKFDKRTKAGQQEAAQFAMANLDKTIIDASDYELIQNMTTSLYKHPIASELLSKEALQSAIIEQSFLFSIRGVNCKIRPDVYSQNEDLLIDLKTTGDASPDGFGKSAFNFRYHVQAAFYLDGFAKVTGKRPKGFVFVAIEKTAPFHVGVYYITESDIELGRETYLKDLKTYADCIKSGKWHGYNSGGFIQELQLPKWAYNNIKSI